jgi:hypothetical protein
MFLFNEKLVKPDNSARDSFLKMMKGDAFWEKNGEKAEAELKAK